MTGFCMLWCETAVDFLYGQLATYNTDASPNRSKGEFQHYTAYIPARWSSPREKCEDTCQSLILSNYFWLFTSDLDLILKPPQEIGTWKDADYHIWKSWRISMARVCSSIILPQEFMRIHRFPIPWSDQRDHCAQSRWKIERSAKLNEYSGVKR